MQIEATQLSSGSFKTRMCSVYPKNCAHHRSVHLRSAGISSTPLQQFLTLLFLPSFQKYACCESEYCLVRKTALGCAPQKKWFLPSNSKETGVKSDAQTLATKERVGGQMPRFSDIQGQRRLWKEEIAKVSNKQPKWQNQASKQSIIVFGFVAVT